MKTSGFVSTFSSLFYFSSQIIKFHKCSTVNICDEMSLFGQLTFRLLKTQFFLQIVKFTITSQRVNENWNIFWKRKKKRHWFFYFWSASLIGRKSLDHSYISQPYFSFLDNWTLNRRAKKRKKTNWEKMKLGPLLTVGCYAGWNGRVHEMEGNFTHLFCLILQLCVCKIQKLITN